MFLYMRFKYYRPNLDRFYIIGFSDKNDSIGI